MAVCPVCGCKTDALDFVQGTVGSWSGDICSFCEKQLKSIDAEKGLTEAQLRWVNAALSKDVVREEELLAALTALSGYAPRVPEVSVAQPSAATYNSANQSTPAYAPVAGGQTDDAAIRQLLQRIESLEQQLRVMKRTALIKTILEICVPIILGIIILIVFFSSGLFDSLSGLYNEFM
ncbi:MAG: hypothetical protein J6Q83_03800 [Clostridia bacterium]|nr:hypothetical protein [Clostridia bacterium]